MANHGMVNRELFLTIVDNGKLPVVSQAQLMKLSLNLFIWKP